MRRAFIAALFAFSSAVPLVLFAASQALAQAPSPAQMGIISTVTPEVLQVLDSGSPPTWVRVGTVNSSTHLFASTPNAISTPAAAAALDRTGVTDSVAAFSALFASIGGGAGQGRIPVGTYSLSTSVKPGVNGAFLVGVPPVASSLPSQAFTFDPSSTFTGAGNINLNNLIPYVVGPITADNVLIHTFTSGNSVMDQYKNIFASATIAFNSGTYGSPAVPLVASFVEGISNCGGPSNAVQACPAWAENIAAFVTADHGHAWGTEVDVGDLSPSGNGVVYGVDIHSIGTSLSTNMFGIHMQANQSGGFTFGWNLDAANGNSPIQTVGSIITVGGSATVAHGIDLHRWTFTTDALATPGFSVDGSGVVTNSGDIISAKATSGNNVGSNFLFFNLTDSVGTAHSVKFWATNSGVLPVFQMIDAAGGSGINFQLRPDGSTPIISTTNASNLTLQPSGGRLVVMGDIAPNAASTYSLGKAGLGFTTLVMSTVAISALPACTSGVTGMMMFVSDTVASAAPAWHANVVGGGAATAKSLVSCNGSTWQYE